MSVRRSNLGRIDTTAATPASAPRRFLDTDPYAGIRVELSEHVVTVTLARPERLNVQSPRLWDELLRVRRELPGTVRVAVLRAEGRAFSAGLDRALATPGAQDGFGGLARLGRAEATARIEQWQRAFDWTSAPGLVSIAAVQGHAVGGGLQLALGADIRILAADAQLSMPEAVLGIVPDLGGTKRLVDLVGYSRALELCLTGRRVGAEEALAIGLAARVVAGDQLDAAVTETVDAVLAVDRAASAETKALLQAAARRTQPEQQAAEREAQYRRLRDLAGLDE